MKSTMSFVQVAALVTGLVVTPFCTANDTSDANAESQPTDEQATQPLLGIGVSPLPPLLTSHLPDVIGEGRGILISQVMENSPAADAGLQKHDVLIRYDDQDLYSPEQLVKRVRNDRPGNEIELQYVRAGKLHTVKVKLAEQPMQAPVESNWSGFARPFDVPVPFKPDLLKEAEDLLGKGADWTHFESLSVTKSPDGKYRATVKYKGEEGESIERTYEGTRQEVRDAIEQDEQLPKPQRQQLLRTLNDRGELTVPGFNFPDRPSRYPWPRELFNWPDVRF